MIETESYNWQSGLCEEETTSCKYCLRVQKCDNTIAYEDATNQICT